MTSAPRGARVVVVGSANADLLVRLTTPPGPGETVLGSSIQVAPGGKGANQAVAAALQGADVGFLGAVGDDDFASTVRSGMDDAGVDLTMLSEVRGPSGVAVVTVTEDGENSIVVLPGANSSVDAEVVARHGAAIGAADVVVLQGEIPRDGIEEAARLTRGRLVVNLAPVLEVDLTVLRAADPLVLNEHEAGIVMSMFAPGAQVPDDERALVAALRALEVPSVVLTLGPRGALVSHGSRDDVAHVPSPRVEAVDTTGAGDAFVGALAAAIAGGEDLLSAARHAARAGAFAVRGHGAQHSYPGPGDELPEVRT